MSVQAKHCHDLLTPKGGVLFVPKNQIDPANKISVESRCCAICTDRIISLSYPDKKETFLASRALIIVHLNNKSSLTEVSQGWSPRVETTAHIFHKKCLRPWILQTFEKNDKSPLAKEGISSCPYCRQNIVCTDFGLSEILHSFGMNRVTAKNGHQQIPLHLVITSWTEQKESEEELIEKIKLLIDADSPINPQDSNKNTPLHEAASNNLSSVVEVLIKAGADINSQNRNKKTPLHLAAEKGFEKTILVLLSRGAQRNLGDYQGNTALHLAIDRNEINVVQLLLEGITPEIASIKNTNSLTPLHYAARISLEATRLVLPYLIEQINATDLLGYTAMHLAACAGQTEVVRILIQNGARSDIKNTKGETALTLAKKFGHKKTASAIQQLAPFPFKSRFFTKFLLKSTSSKP